MSTGAEMSISRTATEVLREHVRLEVKGIDRMYLNVYVPALQRAGGVASFFRFHRGHQFASSAVQFEKGQRKDDVAAAYRKKFTAEEGVLFVGKAQEKTSVFRTSGGAMNRPAPLSLAGPVYGHGQSLLRLLRGPGFGPFFLKFCTYFPY